MDMLLMLVRERWGGVPVEDSGGMGESESFSGRPFLGRMDVLRYSSMRGTGVTVWKALECDLDKPFCVGFGLVFPELRQIVWVP